MSSSPDLQRTGERIAQLTPVVAGERVVETAFALEGSCRAFKALRGKGCRPDPVARRLRLREMRIARARSLTLDETAGKAGRECDRVGGLLGAQLQELGGRGRATEDAVNGARAKTARRRRWNEIARAAALDLVAGDERGQEISPAPPLSLGHGESRRHDQNARMGEHVVGVALIPHGYGHGIGEYCAHSRDPRSVDPQGGPLAGADSP